VFGEELGSRLNFEVIKGPGLSDLYTISGTEPWMLRSQADKEFNKIVDQSLKRFFRIQFFNFYYNKLTILVVFARLSNYKNK